MVSPVEVGVSICLGIVIRVYTDFNASPYSLGYAYRHYKRYSAKRRQRARHRLGDVPPPPSPANVPQVHFPNPGDIALNDLGGLRMWTPEYGDRPARDSTSSGSIPVGLDNGSGDHVIVTPLGPAPPYPGRGSGVNSPIGPAVTAHHTEAVSNTPLTTPDLIPLPSTVANTGPANTAETPLGLIRVDHQVPPYANDVRAERRRREREQMRNRHRGVPREPIVFNDRMWVEYEFPFPYKREIPKVKADERVD